MHYFTDSKSLALCSQRKVYDKIRGDLMIFDCGSSPCNRFYPPTPPHPLSNSVKNASSIVIMLLRYYYKIY